MVEEDTLVSDSDDFISPNVDPGLLAATVNQMNIDAGVEVTGTSDDDTTGFVSTPTPLAQDVVDREDKLLKEMNGVPDTTTSLLNTEGTEYSPEGSGVTTIDARDDLDKANAIKSSNDFFDEMSDEVALTNKENSRYPSTTGATLGTTGKLGTLTPTQEMVRRQLEFQQYAIDNGLDPATVTAALEKSGTQLGLNDLLNSLMGTNDPAENTISKRQQDELDRQLREKAR